MAEYDVSGKVALITGSSRGIGLATAGELGSRGARLVINARGLERLEKARESLKARGFDVLSVPGDVSSPEFCRGMIEKAIERFGRLDILINNAGVSMRANLDELSAEDCRKIVDVNLMGVIYPSLFAVHELKRNRGSVVFISSIAGLIGLPTGSIYCATKSAVRGFADSIRCELEPVGVHVGVVYVGFTENDPEKKVLGAQGQGIAPNRPAHMTQAETARRIAGLIQNRKRDAVLTPIGKLAEIVSRISPAAVEKSVVLSRKYKIAEFLKIR